MKLNRFRFGDTRNECKPPCENFKASVSYEPGESRTGLFGGLARVGWLLAHLADGPDADAAGAAIEARLIRSSAPDAPRRNDEGAD